MTVHIWSTLCLAWSRIVFQKNYGALTPKVRAMRLLEEALELAQAENVLGSEAETILNQVYNKPQGLPYKELGGVLITVAAYAGTKEYDLEECFTDEFARIMHPDVMNRVRTRNLSGDKIGLEGKQ